MTKANDLVLELLSESTLRGCDNLYDLLKLGVPSYKDWLDSDWYEELLRTLIAELQQLRLIRNAGDVRLSFSEARIPVLDAPHNSKVEKLWEIFYKLSNYEQHLPAKFSSSDWAEVIESWGTLGIDLSSISLAIENLITELEEIKTIENLESKISLNNAPFDILNKTYELLAEIGSTEVLNTRKILPDQNGFFRVKPGLYRDDGIDEELKTISKLLGDDVRTHLADDKIGKNTLALLSSKKEKELLGDVDIAIKDLPEQENSTYMTANANLFSWLLKHDELDQLEGFPILSVKKWSFVNLSSSSKETPIAPKELWDERAKSFADLFPEWRLVSSDYFAKVPNKNDWGKLVSKNLVLS